MFDHAEYARIATTRASSAPFVSSTTSRRFSICCAGSTSTDHRRRRFSSTRASTCHVPPDRKSTRLNSSHVANSYAVFCLNRKQNKQTSEHHKAPHRNG